MATIVRVNKSRKDQGKCPKCGKELPAGTGYKWFQADRFSPKLKRCLDCPDWRLSERTSGKIATAYAAQEDAGDALQEIDWHGRDIQDVLDDIQAVLEQCATGVEECRDEYQESLDNMPEQLQDADTGQQIQEKIDILESFMDELGSKSFDYPDEDELKDTDSFFEGVIQEAQDLVDSLEL